MIELKEVWKNFKVGDDEFSALSGVNLDVFPEEFLVIMGPSGSGKSTMLNSVGALDTPSKGNIILDGKNILDLEESDLAQLRNKKIGFVFQAFNLINSLTALDNVALPLIFNGTEKEERIRKAEELLGKVGLSHRKYSLPNQLSGGEKQRVAIARALVNNPEVILADEPTGNLDSKTGTTILELLQELKEKEGKTLIIVTHDDKIAKQADRIARLKDGKIINIEKKV
ncbi:macrolide ABC transporter ATP-binding protein [archaeon]|nr:macrolide ABC transporter ATP-binding protein [archaeon]